MFEAAIDIPFAQGCCVVLGGRTMVKDGREEIGVKTLPIDEVAVNHRFHLRLG